MKTINKFFILTLLLAFSISCEIEDEDVVTENYETGGLLDVQNSLLTYVVGNQGPYSASFLYDTAPVTTTSVDVYKKYFRSSDGMASDEALLKTIQVPDGGTYTFDFTYADLIAGLTFDGGPLPTNDAGLSIADYFELSYRSNTSEGNVHVNAAKTKVSVGTRLAGIYEVVENEYYHYGSPRINSFVGYERIIESIALTPTYTIYSFRNFLYWDDDPGTTFFFWVYNDPIVPGGDEYQIEIPQNDANGDQQLFVATYDVASCSEIVAAGPTDPFFYTCDDTFVTLKVDGKDEITMIYGYEGSGAHINPNFSRLVKQ